MLIRSKIDRFLTFLGAVGFVVSIFLAPQVFPNASVDLSVPRQTIHQQAEEYLQAHLKAVPQTKTDTDADQSADLTVTEGVDLSTYKSVQRFRSDRTASFYLQRTLGIPETKRLTKVSKLPLYYWHLRWFRPSQQEEFSADYSPAGELVRLDHIIPESAPGASLEEDAAQAIAEAYLQRGSASSDLSVRNWDLADWSLADASSTQLPNRTDHTFIWKRRDFEAGEAELRLTVGVQGDNVGYYSYWLKTPEAFSRAFSEERDRAWFFSNIFYLIGFYGPLSIAFIFFIIAIARQQINWRSGLSPAILYFLVSLLSRLNALPLNKSYYSTTQNYALFWIEAIYQSVFYAASAAVPIYFLWLGGQQIAKRVWPQRDMFFPRSPNRLQAFTQAYWRGLMMGGIGLGYFVLFYGISTHFFGVWSPMEVSYSDLLSTPFPFLSPIRSCILPAISEELQARLIGIGIVFLLVRRWWLALLIPGAIWACAHLGYVNDPIYLRGIELTIKAVLVYGVFFLMFGLLTTMVGHCVHNSLLGASLLFQAEDPYLVFSGVLIIALLLAPLLPGVLQQWMQPEKMVDPHADAALDIVIATSADYTLLRRLPLLNYDLNTTVFDKGEKRPNYEVVCLKMQASGTASEAASGAASEIGGDTIEGVAIAKLTDAENAIVQMVYVHPRYRRCYYGTQLVNALTQRLHHRGIRTIEAETLTHTSSESLFWANQKGDNISRRIRLEV